MEKLGRYRILERLGADALGELSRAHDTRVGRTVALRIVSPAIAADQTRRQALLGDASAARALSHPHVAALFDAGEEDGRVFLAHEYMTGRSLRAHMTGTPLDVNRALEFAVQLASGVAEGHRLGLLHLNLGPSTVFITRTDKVKIVEFGLSSWTEGGLRRRAIAERLDSGQELSAPAAGNLVEYMSPEQILAGRADSRSDIFSLGALFYEMATGRNPFGASTPEATALNVLHLQPPPASRTNPALPRKFDAILAQVMAKSTDARYHEAAGLTADLRALTGRLYVNAPGLSPRPR
jgi:serine/threonine protein kinase